MRPSVKKRKESNFVSFQKEKLNLYMIFVKTIMKLVASATNTSVLTFASYTFGDISI